MIRKRCKTAGRRSACRRHHYSNAISGICPEKPEFAYSAENGRHSAIISWSLMKFQIWFMSTIRLWSRTRSATRII